jgi:uncharacterized repeat protein (TIGR03803 family)
LRAARGSSVPLNECAFVSGQLERSNPRLGPAEKLRRTLCGLLVLAVTGCGGGGGGSTAQPAPPLSVTAELLYSFGGTSTDAINPSGLLIQGTDGNFYGTTQLGGLPLCPTNSNPNASCGTVYKITPTGEETVLHSFAGAPADGDLPNVLIQGSDGNFYGTTGGGGANKAGTVFKLTPAGVETILYSFTGGSNGVGAVGLVQGSDGNFYGTSGGGANTEGTIFKLTPAGVETILYSFAGTTYPTGNGAANDGAGPVGTLIQGSDGNFYGVTEFGGLPSPVTNNTTTCGTVFKVTPEGVETILYRFSGTDGDGCFPYAGLMQGSDGNFYGTTAGVNTSFGTVFEVTPEGVETTLHTFSPADGVFPMAQLTQGSDGNFYGTASGGGASQGGTAFQVTPAGVFTVLYSFPNTSDNSGLPGAEPETNLVQGSDGNFYGTTYQNGAYNLGYFFKLIVQ